MATCGADGLHLQPRVPRGLKRATISNIGYSGDPCDIAFTALDHDRTQVRIKPTIGPADRLKLEGPQVQGWNAELKSGEEVVIAR